MELSPCVGTGVECVDVVWIGTGICFAAVDDDYMVSPESSTVAAAFCGWWRRVG